MGEKVKREIRRAERRSKIKMRIKRWPEEKEQVRGEEGNK